MDTTQHWVVMAALTPTLWAIGCLIDSCLIGHKIYRTPVDGVIISCLFCILPVLLVFSLNTPLQDDPMSVRALPYYAVAAGCAYASHLYFYFRTLFKLNDVSGTETFVALSVLVVPFLAWLILDENLPAHYYAGFLIAASGVVMQCLPAFKIIGRALAVNLLACVLLVSLSMVLQTHALKTHGFGLSTAAFNGACFTTAVAIILANKRCRLRIVTLCKKHAGILVTGEILGICAVLSSHRATQLGPSVSLVALIECLLPIFIIAISYGVIQLNRLTPILSSNHQKTLALQISGVQSKVSALLLLLLAVVTLTL